MFKHLVIGLSAMLASTLLSAAPRYVESPPLKQTLSSVSVQDVKTGPVQVPIIT